VHRLVVQEPWVDFATTSTMVELRQIASRSMSMVDIQVMVVGSVMKQMPVGWMTTHFPEVMVMMFANVLNPTHSVSSSVTSLRIVLAVPSPIAHRTRHSRVAMGLP
jgi:hypothetical protein